MRKYWNALRYGNGKTKRILISAILLGIAAVLGAILAAVGQGAIWGLIAVFAAVLDIVIIQSVRFGEVFMRENPGTEKEGAKKKKDDIGEIAHKGLNEITQEDIKKLFIFYKVKKEHVPIMIDLYAEERVMQSPAYLWKDRGYLHLLVLGEKPRNLAVPMSRVNQITYLKNVEVEPRKEYEQLCGAPFLNMMFQEFLPTYAQRQKNGRKVFVKNLYVIAPGIRITNTSIKNANQVLSLPISLDEAADPGYGEFYREAYRMKILLMDQVLSSAEYKEQIAFLLKRMAKEESDQFAEDLSRMLRTSLVTKEVADYYMEYHQKQEQEKRKNGKNVSGRKG